MLTQGSFRIQEYQNNIIIDDYNDYLDVHITCKYGWWNMENQTITQVGTLNDVSLIERSSHDFINIGDLIIEANWDDEQHMMEQPVLCDVILTINGMKINRMSFTSDSWTAIGDCDTLNTGINNGNPLEFNNYERIIYVELTWNTRAWQTTEPYFGTGVIADGVYVDAENNYIVVDNTNHPGEMSFSSTSSWNSSDVRKYSKQTSGTMFYVWNPGDVTQCSTLNHYTWPVSRVSLCYDNTTNLTIQGAAYTKQNSQPTPSTEPDLTGRYYYTESSPTQPVLHFTSNSAFEIGQCGYLLSFNYTMTQVDSTTWTISYRRGPDTMEMTYDTTNDRLTYYTVIYNRSEDPCQPDEPVAPDFTNKTYYNSELNKYWKFTSASDVIIGTCGGNSNNATYTLTYNSNMGQWKVTTSDGHSLYWNEQENSLAWPGDQGYVYTSEDPCVGGGGGGTDPEPETNTHIWLSDNAGEHLVEMKKSGSSWTATGVFTSGMYSVRATVEDTYDNAWFKFYQKAGDNNVYVGAGNSDEFTEIGEYIVISNILTSFTLQPDSETGFYVVTYQNVEAMTQDMVRSQAQSITDTAINSLVIPSKTSDLNNDSGFVTENSVNNLLRSVGIYGPKTITISNNTKVWGPKIKINGNSCIVINRTSISNSESRTFANVMLNEYNSNILTVTNRNYDTEFISQVHVTINNKTKILLYPWDNNKELTKSIDISRLTSGDNLFTWDELNSYDWTLSFQTADIPVEIPADIYFKTYGIELNNSVFYNNDNTQSHTVSTNDGVSQFYLKDCGILNNTLSFHYLLSQQNDGWTRGNIITVLCRPKTDTDFEYPTDTEMKTIINSIPFTPDNYNPISTGIKGWNYYVYMDSNYNYQTVNSTTGPELMVDNDRVNLSSLNLNENYRYIVYWEFSYEEMM